jgi:hypothetical protein
VSMPPITLIRSPRPQSEKKCRGAAYQMQPLPSERGGLAMNGYSFSLSRAGLRRSGRGEERNDMLPGG